MGGRGLDGCCSAPHEMEHKQDQAHNQGNVNDPGGYVKSEKSKQPKNDQHSSDYPKHFLSPRFRSSEHPRSCSPELPDACSRAGEHCTKSRLVPEKKNVCVIVHTLHF